MYITEEQLKGFDKYKYKSIDTSPLANYILHPFWNQFVKLFPLWVAPNVLTFVGFLLFAVQSAMLCYYDPFYKAAGTRAFLPTFVWVFSAIVQFLSHSLDGIDGKQARRTGSSSPLGELFDHGLDSWTASLLIINVFTLFGREYVPVNEMMVMLLVTVFAFFFCHWEKYNTGVLYLPWAYDVSQVFLAVVYTLTALYGYELWHGDVWGYSSIFIFKLSLYVGSVGYSVPVSVYNVVIARREGTVRERSLYETFLPLLSPILAWLIFAAWCILSPSKILEINPRLIMFTAGIVFSNITCRLIVSQMSGTRCQFVNPMLYFVFFCMSAALYFDQTRVELMIMWACAILLTLAHVHYGVVVVRSLADHFNINVFSIKKILR